MEQHKCALIGLYRTPALLQSHWCYTQLALTKVTSREPYTPKKKKKLQKPVWYQVLDEISEITSIGRTWGRGKRQLRSSSKSCPGGAPVTDRDMRVFSTRGRALSTSLLPVWQVREATWQNKAKPNNKKITLNYIFLVHVHWSERQLDTQMGPGTQMATRESHITFVLLCWTNWQLSCQLVFKPVIFTPYYQDNTYLERKAAQQTPLCLNSGGQLKLLELPPDSPSGPLWSRKLLLSHDPNSWGESRPEQDRHLWCL